MGTNYYLHEYPPCACCKRPVKEPLHIGKSSGGWCFSLHVIPEAGIHGLRDWVALFGKEGARIVDESGGDMEISEMLAIITQRRSAADRFYTTPAGYDDWIDFHNRNHSEPGPSGLLRHKLDGRHCIGHGEDTYDLIKGDFC